MDGAEVLSPSLVQFNGSSQTVGTPAISSSISEDIYLTVLDLPGDNASARIGVLIMPMAGWLWMGGGVIGVGTILSAVPRRRRRETLPADQASADRIEATVDVESSKRVGVS